MTLSEPTSPRIAALERGLADGDDPIPVFWASVAEDRAPIIEEIDGAPGEVLVTFLWHGTSDTRNVRVINDDVLPSDPTDNAMTRLGSTDVWFKTYRLPTDLRFEYLLGPNDPALAGRTPGPAQETFAAWQPDPLNRKQYLLPDDGEHPEWEEFFAGSTWAVRTNSLVELPDAPAQPLIERPPDGARGTVRKHRFDSRVLANTRAVYVYTPVGYETQPEPFGTGIWFDAWGFVDIVPVPTILDNLIAQRAIPPMVAVIVDHPTLHERMAELSFPTPIPPFARFVTDELVPWVRSEFHVTSDPARTMLGGASNGGDMAVAIALQRPDLFGRVLSESGTFGRSPDGDPEPEWLARLAAETPHRPIRFYLEAGSLEMDPGRSGVPILVSNRHLRTVFRAKGYEVTLAEYSGGHQPVCWRGTLGQGITASMS